MTGTALAPIPAEDQYLLVFYSKNYADEFDVRGARLTTQKEWDAHLNMARLRFNETAIQAAEDPMELEPLYVYFGSNQSMEYYTFAEYLRAFTIVPISAVFAAELKTIMAGVGVSELGRVLLLEPPCEDSDA